MDKESETSNTRDFVTTSEAAEALGVSYYTVYEYIKEKRLVADMVGGIYMIPKKAVQEFKARPTGRIRTRPPLWRKYRSEEHTSELQSHSDLVCRLLLEKEKKKHSKCKND